MQERSISRFNHTINVAISTIAGFAGFTLLSYIGSLSGSEVVLLVLSFIGYALGVFLGDLLQGVYKYERNSQWVDEEGQVYGRWTTVDAGDAGDLPLIPSEWGIPLSGLVLGILLLVSGEILEALVATPLIVLVLYGINIIVLKLVTDPLNRYRLRQAGEQLFKEQKEAYRTSVSRAEQEVQESQVTDEVLEEPRSHREECNRIKDKYEIKKTTYDIDERLESLESQLEKQQAKERIGKLEQQIGNLVGRMQSARDAGSYDRALEALDELADPLSEAERLRDEYGFDVGFDVSSEELERLKRSIIEDQYEEHLAVATEQRQQANEALNEENYQQAQRRAETGLRHVSEAEQLAKKEAYLSKQECHDERESLIPIQVKAIGNHVAEIEDQFRTQDGHERAKDRLDTLESSINTLEQSHQSTSREETKKDIIVMTGKVQTVLLQARLLVIEHEAKRAVEQFDQGAYQDAKGAFERLVKRLDDIRERTPTGNDETLDVLKEYETELDKLQEVCETNAERARKMDLGINSELTMKSTDIVGQHLRDDFVVNHNDTEVFDPSGHSETNGDTQIYDPADEGSSGETEVFDTGDSQT